MAEKREIHIVIIGHKLCGHCPTLLLTKFYQSVAMCEMQCHSTNASANRFFGQEGPPIGGAVRNATSLITPRLSHTMLAITCSENIRASTCMGELTATSASIFRGQEQKCLIGYIKGNEAHESQFPKLFQNRLNHDREIATRTLPKMISNRKSSNDLSIF